MAARLLWHLVARAASREVGEGVSLMKLSCVNVELPSSLNPPGTYSLKEYRPTAGKVLSLTSLQTFPHK